jgi:hypothetical protein
MKDVAYILISVGFFALMLAYVWWCERLGRRSDAGEPQP